jgi:site-specific DNA recombinase
MNYLTRSKGMKAAIYVRVSTDEQASDGYSIAAQIKALELYSINNNLIVHQVYADEGVSGQKEDRPQFQNMIRDAEKGLFNIILVHKFDRFARRVELSQKIKNRLKKANVNVISITEPIEDSPIGFFQEGLLELLSEYFIRNLSTEIKKGQAERAAQGWHNGWLPYGYVSINGVVEVEPRQAEAIRVIYDLYINHGYGYGKIAKHLNYSEITTQTGKKWSHHQVDRILCNVKYAGWISYAGKTYDSRLPHIIDRDTFIYAQELRRNKENKSFGYRGSNYNKYLLQGLIRCGECGQAFRSWNQRGRVYYGCNYALRFLGDDKCNHIKHYNLKKLEPHILDSIKEVLENKSATINIVKFMPISDAVENITAKLKTELSRAKTAYLEGIFTLAEYADVKRKIESQLNEYALKENRQVNTDIIRNKIKNGLDEFYSYPEDDILNRKNTLKKFIHEIKISKNGIVIEYKG